jgi:putative ABC transport system ATP-binding protein
MVTHDPVAASYADRVLVLADGRIVADMPQPGADRIAEHLAGLGRRRVSQEG